MKWRISAYNALRSTTGLRSFHHEQGDTVIFLIERVEQRIRREDSAAQRQTLQTRQLEGAQLGLARRLPVALDGDGVDVELIVPRVENVRRQRDRHPVVDGIDTFAQCDRLEDKLGIHCPLIDSGSPNVQVLLLHRTIILLAVRARTLERNPNQRMIPSASKSL